MQGDQDRPGTPDPKNKQKNSPPNNFWILKTFQVIKNSKQVIKPEITWMARKIIPQKYSAGNGTGN